VNDRSPLEVFEAYIAGVNARDIDGVMELFSEEVRAADMTRAIWGKPGDSMKVVLRNYIQTAVINSGGVLTVLGTVEADGWVYGVLELRSQFVAKLGIDRIRGVDEIQVNDGLITAFQFIPSVNDEQTKVFSAAAGGGDLPGPPREGA
jgi:hypothetical protein